MSELKHITAGLGILILLSISFLSWVGSLWAGMPVLSLISTIIICVLLYIWSRYSQGKMRKFVLFALFGILIVGLSIASQPRYPHWYYVMLGQD